MRITEEKEVIRKTVEDVTIGRKCDCCGKDIVQKEKLCGEGGGYDYFVLTTSHNDWGNDSCESFEYFDACSAACTIKMVSEYLKKYNYPHNTRRIEVEHANHLDDGTDRDWKHSIVDE